MLFYCFCKSKKSPLKREPANKIEKTARNRNIRNMDKAAMNGININNPTRSHNIRRINAETENETRKKSRTTKRARKGSNKHKIKFKRLKKIKKPIYRSVPTETRNDWRFKEPKPLFKFVFTDKSFCGER